MILASPTQQVLDTAELLATIMGCFKGDDTPTVHEETQAKMIWKRQLAPIARVNRTFYYAAIEVLWETMDSLRPFLAILKSDYTTEPNVRNVKPLLQKRYLNSYIDVSLWYYR